MDDDDDDDTDDDDDDVDIIGDYHDYDVDDNVALDGHSEIIGDEINMR